MEQLTFGRARQSEGGAIYQKISGEVLRKRFCDLVGFWGVVAASKDITMVIDFSPDLPEYFAGEDGLFTDILAGLLEYSVSNLREGLIRVEVLPLPGPGQRDWWLTVVVDDSGDNLTEEASRYLNGEGLEFGSGGNRAVEKLGWLMQKWRRHGCEVIVASRADRRQSGDKYHWGCRYLVRIPCLKGGPERLTLRHDWSTLGTRVYRDA